MAVLPVVIAVPKTVDVIQGSAPRRISVSMHFTAPNVHAWWSNVTEDITYANP